MGIVFRQSVKTSIVILLGAIIGIIFTYWQTKVMPKREIGISKNIIYQGAVLQSLLLFGVHSIVHTYIQRYTGNDAKRGTLLGAALLVPLLGGIIFCIPYFLFHNWIISKYQLIDQPYIRQFFYWLPLLVLLYTYITLFESYLLAKMKVALATFMREIVLRVANLILLVLFGFNYIDFQFFIIGTILCYFIPLITLVVIASKETDIKLSLNFSVFTKSEIKNVVHYAWYHTLIGAALNVVGFIDALMLAPLSKDGSSNLAVYSIALFLIGFVNIPYKAMMTSAFPKLNQIFLNSHKEHLFDFFNRTNINILVATVFVGVLMLSNMHNAVVLLPKGYESLESIFMILFLGRLIDVSTGLNQEFIGITPHYKFTFWASLVYILIAVVCNRIFIPRYGIYGAAWVSTMGLAVFNIIKAIFLKQKFGLYPFEKKGFWIFPIGILGYFISWLMPAFSNPFLDGLIRTPIVAIVMIMLIFWLRPSKDVKDYWLSIKKSKRLY
jgi:O-antigen/teichoic acid export membrane protein